MPGFSITLLLLPSKDTDTVGPSSSHVLSLLDQPCDVSGWRQCSVCPPAEPSSIGPSTSLSAPPAVAQERAPVSALRAEDPEAFVQAIGRACNALIKAEPEITKMDVVAGDGDCGTTLKASEIRSFGLLSFSADFPRYHAERG
jgi:triose/dihydroxyacetone kinase / FAD-AMP lyase (cyclizing)